MNSYDLIVVGGGPAGTAAAIEAARRGLNTLLIDESPAAGGQVYRAPLPGLGGLPSSSDLRAGHALRNALAASSVSCAFSHRVWLVERGFAVFSLGPDGPVTHSAAALILATGALERHLPIPGWTLPGVISLAGASLLLKAHSMLPGRRVVVAGSGPLLPLVAIAIIKGGGEVAAVVDATPCANWIVHILGLLSRPDLLTKGAGWVAKLLMQGVPILSGHALSRIEGVETVEGAVVVPLDHRGAPRPDAKTQHISCDAVCYGVGLLPSTEATRLLRAIHHYAPELGGWVARTDRDQRTSVPRLYVAGDGAGVLGAAAAPLTGRLAALAALQDLNRIDLSTWTTAATPLRRRLARATNFARRMAVLTRPRPGTIDLVTQDTIVCRCEGIRREILDRAVANGAVTPNDLKSVTRCGMGPCSGRVCADVVAAVIAATTGQSRAAIAEMTGRPPLRPMPIDRLVGDFDYDDIPIPAAAPL